MSKIEDIKKQLDQIGCNSFFSLKTINVETGTPYIHIEFQYKEWNGINFYFYKLFNKSMEPSMVEFFESNLTKINEGRWKSKGGILDSNAIWYYKND
jgi:hypothetical protein